MTDLSAKVQNAVPYDLTVVIPARDEARCVGQTVDSIFAAFFSSSVHLEVIVVDDHSADLTATIAREHGARLAYNRQTPGYGTTVRIGLNMARGRYVAVMVADGSDNPDDLVWMYDVITRGPGCDAVWGHRWGVGASVEGYPRLKRLVNRLGNRLVGRVLRSSYSDWTNPFKLYRTELVKNALPSCRATDFSLGMELAARVWQARTEAFKLRIVPHHWKDRASGKSKFKVRHAFLFLRTLYRLLPQETRDGHRDSLGVILMFAGVMTAWLALR